MSQPHAGQIFLREVFLAEFAHKNGISLEAVTAFIESGRLDETLARGLAGALGTTAEYWLSLARTAALVRPESVSLPSVPRDPRPGAVTTLYVWMAMPPARMELTEAEFAEWVARLPFPRGWRPREWRQRDGQAVIVAGYEGSRAEVPQLLPHANPPGKPPTLTSGKRKKLEHRHGSLFRSVSWSFEQAPAGLGADLTLVPDADLDKWVRAIHLDGWLVARWKRGPGRDHISIEALPATTQGLPREIADAVQRKWADIRATKEERPPGC